MHIDTLLQVKSSQETPTAAIHAALRLGSTKRQRWRNHDAHATWNMHCVYCAVCAVCGRQPVSTVHCTPCRTCECVCCAPFSCLAIELLVIFVPCLLQVPTKESRVRRQAGIVSSASAVSIHTYVCTHHVRRGNCPSLQHPVHALPSPPQVRTPRPVVSVAQSLDSSGASR